MLRKTLSYCSEKITKPDMILKLKAMDCVDFVLSSWRSNPNLMQVRSRVHQ